MSDGYLEDEPQIYEGAAAEMEPIPVVEMSETVAPEYGACMTWTVGPAATSTPTQIFQRRIRRHKGKLVITSLSGATAIVVNSNRDALTQPTPVGASFVATGSLPDWESQQPLYAVAIGGTGATIACWDEAYAER